MDTYPARLPMLNRLPLMKVLASLLILGLLGGIAVPLFFDQRKRGHDGDAKGSLTAVANAITMYAETNQQLPALSVSGSSAGLDDGTTVTLGAGVILGDLTGTTVDDWCIDVTHPHGDRAKTKGYKFTQAEGKVEEGLCA